MKLYDPVQQHKEYYNCTMVKRWSSPCA